MKSFLQTISKVLKKKKDRGREAERETEQNTSIEFKVEFSRVGSALVPTYASPSIDKFSNRTSIFGISIPTLKKTIKRS